MSDREDDVVLKTVLRPAPPLNADVLKLILIIVAGINLAFATFFLARGAWPIAPFMGADVALLAWAFWSSRKAAEREEHVTLTPSLLSVIRKPRPKNQADVSLNPYWVRVAMDVPPEHGGQLMLWSHGKGFRIGAFLPPAERAVFASRLKTALWRVKSGLG